MNVLVWWVVLVIPAWFLTAWILWRTNIVVSGEDASDEGEEE